MGKKAIREFENTLVGLLGGIAQYRKGIDEYFIPYGFIIAREKLNAARKDLHKLELLEKCQHAIDRAEELVKLGPQHDEEADALLLSTTREVMSASGTHARMSAIALKPGVTLDDFKPDPDRWGQADEGDGA
jgi:hypothetical protein